jgi:muramoyltetrapeptide carboxypeptidase LdcA involved in peptidoglycan recycling
LNSPALFSKNSFSDFFLRHPFISFYLDFGCASLKKDVSLMQFMESLDQVVKSYGLAGVKYNLDDVNSSASFGGFYANSDRNRANVLRQTLLDPNVKAIWCGRGGYGAAEVIQIFQQEGFKFTEKVKPLIGFSDITALHYASTRGYAVLD